MVASDTGLLALAAHLQRPVGLRIGRRNEPRELFAADFAACFHGAMTLFAISRRLRLPQEIAIGASRTTP
jgi:lipoyl-dependent peroxiredoxin